MPIVPCPAITSGSSYGCTNVARALLLQRERLRVGIRVRVAVQHDLRAARLDRRDLDVRRRHRHDDRRLAAEASAPRARHPARGCPPTPRSRRARARAGGQVRHLVVRAAQLEREHAAAGPRASAARGCRRRARQRRRELERRLDRDVVDLRGQDLLQVVDRHGAASVAGSRRVGQRRPLTARGVARSARLRAAARSAIRHRPMLDALHAPFQARRAPDDARRRRHGQQQLPPRGRARRGRPDLPARHGARDAAHRRRHRRATDNLTPAARSARRSPASRASASGCAACILPPCAPSRRNTFRVATNAPTFLPQAEARARLPDRHHRRTRGGAAHLPRRRARAAAVATRRGSSSTSAAARPSSSSAAAWSRSGSSR